MGQPQLPEEVYVQEDIDVDDLTDGWGYLIFILIALCFGSAFGTQYFAWRLEYPPGLPVHPNYIYQLPPALNATLYHLSVLLLSTGFLGFPIGFWYSAQPQTLRFRALASISCITLSVGALCYAYSLPYSFSFWRFLHWILLYSQYPDYLSLVYEAGVLSGSVFLVSLIGFVLGSDDRTFEIDDAYGSAHWGDGEWFKEVVAKGLRGKLNSSDDLWGVPIGWRGSTMLFDREGIHTYVQAPTGSGKTVGFVIPTLLMHKGSVLCIDIKRELYHVAARRRYEMNGKVCRLDPFATDIEPDRYNPFSLIETRPGEEGVRTAIDDARSIADALILDDNSGNRNPFFISAAESILYGLTLYVCATHEPGSKDRNLGKVRSLLTRANGSVEDPGEDTIRGLLRQMGQFNPPDNEAQADSRGSGLPPCAKNVQEAIRGIGNQFSDTAPKEFSAVLSTARNQTEFLESKQIQNSLSDTTFQFREMQTRYSSSTDAESASSDDTAGGDNLEEDEYGPKNGLSVFLSLPADRMSDYYRWLRLMIISARTEIIRLPSEDRVADNSSLFMIEEAPRLGRMEILDEGLSLDRGYGIQYMVVVQSYNQLKDSYGEDMSNNILSNCRLKMMWGAATRTDAEMISKQCGKQTVAFETVNQSDNSNQGGPLEGGGKSISENVQEQERDLVTPDEVSRISEDWTFVFTRGEAPLLLKRPNYVEDASVFQKHADPHPEYASSEELKKARERRREELGFEDPPDQSTSSQVSTGSLGGDGAPSVDEPEVEAHPDLGIYEPLTRAGDPAFQEGSSSPSGDGSSAESTPEAEQWLNNLDAAESEDPPGRAYDGESSSNPVADSGTTDMSGESEDPGLEPEQNPSMSV